MLGDLAMRRVAFAVGVLILTAATPQTASLARRGDPLPLPGSPDSGDSLFPHQGNGGYAVDHYRIRLTWSRSNEIEAVATIAARSTHGLSSFNLDLRGLTVDSVKVDQTPAAFTRDSTELTVTPTIPVPSSTPFAVKVSYHGSPQKLIDPDGSADGWIRTSDGATVLAEPIGAMTWFPNNNTPRDKAGFDITVTAPETLEVVSNGRLVELRHTGNTRTWHWREVDEMAPYLATVSIGQYDAVRDKTRSGIPLRSYIDPKVGGRHVASKVPRILAYWQSLFGRYPFTAGGIVIDDVPVGYALEVQTRPVFPHRPSTATLVHELAHQWYGNSVTPIDWSDIWLNEGFATYAEWLWEAKSSPGAPGRNFDQLYDSHGPASSFWDIPVAQPGDPSNLFGNAVYVRGAMALQALRMTIGRGDFFTLLRRWARVHYQANATTGQLRTMAEAISGEPLDQLFDDWLYSGSKPPGF